MKEVFSDAGDDYGIGSGPTSIGWFNPEVVVLIWFGLIKDWTRSL